MLFLYYICEYEKSEVTHNKMSEQLVFGLDIGTRSIVGSVGYLEGNKFKVIAHYVKEHSTRAMLDGQIHDIAKVTDTIRTVKEEIEVMVGAPLNDVCIAAAGRVLKTKTVHVDYDMTEETFITSEHIYALDLMGVEKAYEEIRSEEKDIKFYCVGYSVVKYYLNDYVIGNLEGHKGKMISADVLATFLPEEVVDGLYSAVGGAGLNVANLTLEPIAAINIAIPENFRLLNIAMIDVGAGTSDISITKDGSIVAYGMVPRAGDEITESLVNKYLVDFNTAEDIKRSAYKKKTVTFKDVMGLKQKVPATEVKEAYSSTVDSITKELADKITELNGGKSVSAVFVVGGGGKAAGFVEGLSKYLDIPKERAALRGEEVLGGVDFMQEGVKKDPLLVTPIGICLNFYNQKNNFIFVNINGQRIKLYDNDKLTVIDAAMQIEFPNENLFPKRGREIIYYVNDQKRMIRGLPGEPATITINGETANINSTIRKNDVIVIKESTEGERATFKIEQIPEYKSEIKVIVNDKPVICERFAEVNKELIPGSYCINDNDNIKILDYYTVKQLIEFMDIDITCKEIYVNNQKADLDTYVYENFTVRITDTDYSSSNDDEEIIENTEAIDEATNNATDRVTDEKAEEVKSKAAVQTNNLEITVKVNGTSITLNNKASYIMVDILDYYPFDTRTKGLGKELVMTINGINCQFTDAIKDGDTIELYWR